MEEGNVSQREEGYIWENKTASESPSLPVSAALTTRVWNQWNEMVEWTTGMEYWNELGQDLFACI